MGYAKYSEDINDRRSEEFSAIDIGTGQSKPRYHGQPTDAHHLDDQPQFQRRLKDSIRQFRPLLRFDALRRFEEVRKSALHWIAAVGAQRANGRRRAIDSGDTLIRQLHLAKDALKLDKHEMQQLQRLCNTLREKLKAVPANCSVLLQEGNVVLQQVADYQDRLVAIETECDVLTDDIVTAMLAEVVEQRF